MGAPHATVVSSGQDDAHAHRPPWHTCPAAHWVPVPQLGPPEQRLAMVCPQGTLEGAVLGHRGAQTHCPDWQVCPLPQRVPVPAQLAPWQVLGMGRPQSTLAAEGHDGTHSQRPLAQR